MQDLSVSLNKSACFILNGTSGLDNLFAGDHTLSVSSDADEQLIIHIAFNATVNISNLELGIPPDDSCPATIKLFNNRNNLDFAACAEEKPTQVVDLEPAEGPTRVPVKLAAVKWNRCDSITIFVESNHGAAQSKLFSLKMFGTPVHGTNVADIGKGG